ncbi:MAG: MATE family efflux transporter [Phycisphaerae bacterium]|nr:MATE family efflux transporter [Phycisphaerae bacterium]MDD5381208.1 MATE family efflux transporter [Phycisphaerae bacterium]
MTEESTLLSKNHITDESSLKYMLKLAAPMVVTNISFTVMQFVDRFMVSRLGTEALAAILPAGIISFVPVSFAIGVMTSVNTFVSQSLGRGQKKDCSNYCWQAIYMGLAYIVLVAAIMWPAAPWIFRTLGHEPGVVALEVVYLRIMLYSQFLSIFTWASTQFLMGIHRPIITMYASLVGQVVNVTANYALIFGHFGFPAMGVAGAGWGTFIGVGVGAVMVMAMFLGNEINSNFASRRTTNIDLAKMKDLVKVGFPAGAGFIINMSFWGIILFGLVGRFGKESLAATSAVFSCMSVSFMPIVGLGTALTAAVGRSIGKGRKEMAIKQTAVCLRVALIYMGLVGLCFLLFRNNLMAFWSPDDKEVVAIGINIFIFAAIFQVFDGMLLIYYNALCGAGDTLWLAIVEAVSATTIMGIGGFCMIKFFPEFGALGPWGSATVKIILIAMANRWRFKSGKWMQIDLFKRRPVGVPVEIEAVIE